MFLAEIEELKKKRDPEQIHIIPSMAKATMLNSIYGRLSLLLVRVNARAFVARSISETTTMDLLEGLGSFVHGLL